MSDVETELVEFLIIDIEEENDLEKATLSPEFEEMIIEEELMSIDVDEDVNDFYEDLDNWNDPFKWDED